MTPCSLLEVYRVLEEITASMFRLEKKSENEQNLLIDPEHGDS
jgi:hypothetical protein